MITCLAAFGALLALALVGVGALLWLARPHGEEKSLDKDKRI